MEEIFKKTEKINTQKNIYKDQLIVGRDYILDHFLDHAAYIFSNFDL